MQPQDIATLLDALDTELVNGARSVGILGLTTVTHDIVAHCAARHVEDTLEGVYVASSSDLKNPCGVSVRLMNSLLDVRHDVLVVAADEAKEDLLECALPFISGSPKVLISGYGHLRFRDATFQEEAAQILVPSLANGYPHTLVHLYQCLSNAARLKLEGVVVEFGMFKGGTTMLLSRWIKRLGMPWPVIGFDTFAGFPARRSPLDMYAHPGCVFSDLRAVQHYIDGHNVEVVPGDIVDTCRRLDEEAVVLAFVDTDNYTSAAAALDVVVERVVVGGAVVFDHFTGVDRFLYTIGERMAGKRLLSDSRFFHLHSTGVFYRQR